MIRNGLLLLCLTASLPGCRDILPPDSDARQTVTLRFTAAGDDTRSSDPDELLLSDLNLFIFSEDGNLEEQRYIPARSLYGSGRSLTLSVSLIRRLPYSIYACANFGYRIPGIGCDTQLLSFRHYLTYPDEFKAGIPMSGVLENFVPMDREVLDLPLVRMMSKISVSMDRSGLDSGVSLLVRSVQIGNCPRSAFPFLESGAMNAQDTFGQGFIKTYSAADALNRETTGRHSDEVDVYMLENRQEDRFDEDLCSFIEIKSEYNAPQYHTGAEEYLVYRFRLGEGEGNYDIYRNCHYHFCVKPTGDGLGGTAWSVDKTGLHTKAEAGLRILPENPVTGHVGETLHVWAECTPPETPLDIGREELEFDRERGIYDYTVDADGRGVQLRLKKPGTGILYMQAGEPVNDAALAVVVVL